MKQRSLILTILVLFLTYHLGWSQDQPTSDNTVDEPDFFQNELAPKNQVEIYPNPTINYLFVEIKNSTLEDVEFEMHSIIGTKVNLTYEELGNFKFRIPVEELNPGYYFLLIKDPKTRYNRALKFVKR